MDKEKLMTEEEWIAKYNANQKKSKKKNAKKWARNGVALGLVAVLSIAGTLAYLQKKTDPKVNTFTGSAGLRLELTESNWDTDNDGAPDDGEPMKEAGSYIPGTVYTKNPQLVNFGFDDKYFTNGSYSWDDNVLKDTDSNDVTSVDTADNYAYSEYVAFEVDLLDQSDKKNNPDKSLSYGKLNNVIEDIVFDSRNWQLLAYYDTTWKLCSSTTKYFTSDGKLDTATTPALDNATKFVFAYATVVDSKYQYTALSAKNATEPLFSQIKIRQDVYNFADNDTDNAVKIADGETYPQFDIKLIGGAVDTNTYASTTDTNTNTQIGTDLLTVLGAVNSNP